MNNNNSSQQEKRAPDVRILIIEDNRDLALLFRNLVQAMGCTAEVAWSGRSGLELAEKTAPDIIFCDISLPGEKTGFDVARAIRAHKDLAGTWLVAVTGHEDPAMHERALNAGFNRVFIKPVKFAQMHEVLTEFRASQGTRP
ncbi:response regulator [Noviherbaspirillum massiliense]|uniref:response regulator n=1 Tax=Noviherbaspirillum massiliense TaxID=1465823 RepID=UPI0002E1D498|nr:response regulator [Noviherbaspirillum massiliense]